jgi:hypothetical protein
LPYSKAAKVAFAKQFPGNSRAKQFVILKMAVIDYGDYSNYSDVRAIELARAVIEIALDRSAEEAVADFVRPLNEELVATKLGCVLSHGEAHPLIYCVELKVATKGAIEILLELLDTLEVPIGAVVYRRNWLGRKKDVFIVVPA